MAGAVAGDCRMVFCGRKESTGPPRLETWFDVFWEPPGSCDGAIEKLSSPPVICAPCSAPANPLPLCAFLTSRFHGTSGRELR